MITNPKRVCLEQSVTENPEPYAQRGGGNQCFFNVTVDDGLGGMRYGCAQKVVCDPLTGKPELLAGIACLRAVCDTYPDDIEKGLDQVRLQYTPSA